MFKLLMSWDIKPNREEEYYRFLVREFWPAIMKMGIQPTDAWYTAYGDYPQILAGGVTEDLETMRAILESEEWHEWHERLMQYVTNYQQKVVRATGRFQMM